MTDEEILKALGPSSRVAKAMEVTPQAVRNWKARGIPARKRWRVWQLAREAGLKVDVQSFMTAHADAAKSSQGDRAGAQAAEGDSPQERQVAEAGDRPGAPRGGAAPSNEAA